MKLTLRQQQSLWGYIFISPLGPWPRSIVRLATGTLPGAELSEGDRPVPMANRVGRPGPLPPDLDRGHRVHPVLIETLQTVAIDVPLILVVSLLLALLLTGVGRGQTFLRAVLFSAGCDRQCRGDSTYALGWGR